MKMKEREITVTSVSTIHVVGKDNQTIANEGQMSSLHMHFPVSTLIPGTISLAVNRSVNLVPSVAS